MHCIYDGFTTSFLPCKNLLRSYWCEYLCSKVSYNYFSVIRPRTSTISIGRRPGFLSSGINRHARNASKDADWFSMLKIFLITSANAFHRSRDLFPNCLDVKIHFQPSASVSDGIESPWVLTAAFYTFSTSILSNLIGWIVCSVSVSYISWYASFPSGCFTCSWFNFCPVKGKMPFFILSVRICIALLTFPLLISRENLLDIPVMFVNVFFDLKLFWIVSVYFNNSSKSRDIHDSRSISKAFK